MTVTQDAAVALDGPEQTAVFHLLQIKHGLRLEIRTGMKLSRGGSLIEVANRCGYSKKRTKAGVLADVEALIEKAAANKPF